MMRVAQIAKANVLSPRLSLTPRDRPQLAATWRDDMFVLARG
jgi:hypothetical protein